MTLRERPLACQPELAEPAAKAENGAMLKAARSLAAVLVAATLAAGATGARVKPAAARVLPAESRVDINHASLDELLKLPGVTRIWAARIVRFRPYRTKADLVEQGVIPQRVYAPIKELVIAHKGEQ